MNPRCPACTGSVTVVTNTVSEEPRLWFSPETGSATLRRSGLVMTWAGCNRCEWCGPVSETKETR